MLELWLCFPTMPGCHCSCCTAAPGPGSYAQQRAPAGFLQVYVDTTGWAFPYPIAKLAGCKVACYVHYPTVSTNMLGRVWSRQAMYNNDEAVSSSNVRSLIKVLYYQAFAVVYGIAGACAGEQQVVWCWQGRMMVAASRVRSSVHGDAAASSCE